MNSKEIWKDVIGYEGLYKVSNEGNVFSLITNKILKQRINKGYFVITLANEGERKTHSVHRLVAKAFVANDFNKREVNHIDENKLNNNVDNLNWVTSKENSNWGTRNERIKLNHRRFSASGYTRKTGSKIKQICKQTNEIKIFDSLKQAVIETGIHQPNISSCLNGKMKSAGGFYWEKVS